MSRTWKDRPSFVQANDKRNQKKSSEVHWCGWKHYWSSGNEYSNCNLLEDNFRDGRYHYNGCYYRPEDDRPMWGYRKNFVKKWVLKEVQTEVRAERRMKTKKMVDEYNTNGYTEEDYYFLNNDQKFWHWYWD